MAAAPAPVVLATPTQSAAVRPSSKPLPHPLFWAAFAFAGGILWARITAATTHWSPANWLLLAALALALIGFSVIQSYPRLAIATALLALAMLGAANYEVGGYSALPLDPSFDNAEVEIRGWVSRASPAGIEQTVRDAGTSLPAETYQQIDVQAEQIKCIDEFMPCGQALPLGIRVGVHQQAPAIPATFQYGNRVVLRGRIRIPQTYGDPGVFDRRAYLARSGISATLNARAEDIQIEPGTAGTRFRRWCALSRASLLQHILSLESHSRWRDLSISHEDVALLAAMLLGERTLLDQAIKRDFQRTGAYHLLVVSGLAVAIIGLCIFRLLRLLRAPQWLATVASVLAIVLYAQLTDLGAPVHRAVLMAGIYALTRIFYRDRNPLNAIGFAALAVLATGADALFDAGFQMTFLAVIVLAGIALPILERTSAIVRRALRYLDSTSFDLHLTARQAQFRVELRMIAGRLGYFMPLPVSRWTLVTAVRILARLAELLFVSFLLQVTLALPMAIYFHRATTLALPSNVLVVPLVALLIPLALVSTLLSYLGHAWTVLPSLLLAPLLHFVSSAVAFFARFRASDVRVPDPAAWADILFLLALALVLLSARRRAGWVLGSFALLLVSNVAVIYARTPDIAAGKLEVTAIDVGQGDSLLVVTPRGETVLIDGGGTPGAATSGFDTGEDVVSPYLWSRGLRRLTAVALTHAHIDHIGGLPAVLENFRPKELWIAPSPPSVDYDQLIAKAHAIGTRVILRSAGDRFNLGGASFRVLAPGADLSPRARPNQESMVLLVQYGQASALLEGDAERATERAISSELRPVSLLKVAHHGSSTSSIPELLLTTRPQFAVISVGKFNRYQHPRPQVLEGLAEAGSCLFRTDTEGALSFFLDSDGVSSAQVGPQRELMRYPSRWIPPQQAGHCAAIR